MSETVLTKVRVIGKTSIPGRGRIITMGSWRVIPRVGEYIVLDSAEYRVIRVRYFVTRVGRPSYVDLIVDR